MGKRRRRTEQSARSATDRSDLFARLVDEATRRPTAWALGGLTALVLAMFGDVLLAPGGRVLGAQDTDLFLQFVSWRDFGFRELARGNLPLWNPHIYGGAPYHGGMQAALLYPLNWLFLVLPPAAAFNWTIAVNVWLLGAFMWAWCRCRGLGPLASFVAAALLMFSGPHFLHIHAGHVTNLPAMTWAPLVFLAVDAWLEPHGSGLDMRRSGWLLLGMLAVAMQVLSGHPQYVFYTAIAAGIYTLARLPWRDGRAWLAGAAGLAVMNVGGAALAAVQLLPGMQAARETIRDAPLPWEFASMFGFPPENVITLLAPGVLGDMTGLPYWGRCYLWEMSLFFGVGGLVLAVYGARHGRPAVTRALLVAALVTFVLALGRNTPLFRPLYDLVPGFDRFRSVSKFSFQTILFLTMLAGVGLDRMLATGVERRFAVGVGAAAALLGLGAGVAAWIDWGAALRAVAATGESYLDPRLFAAPEFAVRVGGQAVGALVVAAVILAVVALMLVLAARGFRPALLLVLLAGLVVAEVFVVARRFRPTFPIASASSPEWAAFLRDRPGDYRILNPFQHNSAMSIAALDVWGFDPGVVRRYAEFITWTQGQDPATATQYVPFRTLSPALALVRLKYALAAGPQGVQVVEAPTQPLPHALLLDAYSVATGRDAVLAALAAPGFDPARAVVLEEEPEPRPEPGGAAGRVKIVAEDTDWLEIEAELEAPAILLVTDAWTPAWRAVPLAGSSQERYRTLPANHALRAVPLAAGRHRLRMEYAPGSVPLGALVSLVAAVAWCAAGWRWRATLGGRSPAVDTAPAGHDRTAAGSAT